MHELSIVLSILEAVEEEAERHGGATVDAIHVRIGALSGIVNDALISAYQLASEKTPFEHTRLIIEEVPIVVFCSKCQAERTVHSVQWFCCAECDTPASQVVHGRELELSALELLE